MPNPLTLTDVKAVIDRRWEQFTNGQISAQEFAEIVRSLMDAVNEYGVEV